MTINVNRGCIKTAIDIVDQFDDPQAPFVVEVLKECGDEIAMLNAHIDALLAVNGKLQANQKDFSLSAFFKLDEAAEELIRKGES